MPVLYNKLVILLILVFYWINNLFIPLFLYHRAYGLFRKKYKGGGGCNGWSFIMDGLLAGLMNLTVALYLSEIKYNLSINDGLMALFIGVIITSLAHIIMSLKNWNIWIMPKPWQWNIAGYWHMISMTLQVWFFAIVLVLLANNHQLLKDIRTIVMLIIFSIWIILFIWAFFQKDRGLQISKFHLNKEAW